MPVDRLGASSPAVIFLRSVPKGKWEPVQVTLLSPVVLDERRDLAWAECEPALRIDGRIHHVVLLQPRYRESLWTIGQEAVEVYVYAGAREDEASDHLSRSHVRLLAWGVVTDTP